jgi:ribonucleoside-diphosphate reductase alpha chain
MTELDREQNTQSSTKGLAIKRVFTPGDSDPYHSVKWQRVDVVQKNRKTGELIFEQRDVEFPTTWSMNAVTIVTTKYFRGAVGTEEREWSLKQLINRVVDTYTQAGVDHGYFVDEDSAAAFGSDLKWLLVNQYFAFNSPVWFNVGTSSPQQVSACFILAVDDSMESILNWYREEGLIFKGGSGAGINLSRIRSSKELLHSSGGRASGPVSFMRGADASAGSIKSGGATRRAAKMVVLDVDHPDIEEFVETKANEEKKIRALSEAGFDMDLGGHDISSVQYQNANNSVRVSDAFMHAARNNISFDLTSRTTGETVETIDAAKLLGKISQAAWECADPGLQYDDSINGWHTCPETGRINASNPCSEYLHIDNSSCNLASLNLLKFLRNDDTFDVASFTKAVELIIVAMDISICFADFPTEAITQNTRDYRQLGIGYANLGALLMAMGLGYDSNGGRTMAAAITSLMTGAAYRRSAELAEAVGPYAGYAKNASAHLGVIHKHYQAHDVIQSSSLVDPRIADAAGREWWTARELGREKGFRNAQASVLAPTGTIGFMMDCDTTGIEPDFSLTKYKKLVGGGDMQIVNQTISRALVKLGYDSEKVEAIVTFIAENGHVIDAPSLKPEHYEIFDCATGARALEPMGHVRMMAACQPFISGAISKTVNMPETATVEEIQDVYVQAWELGLKVLAVYRDNCKVGQPLSAKREAADDVPMCHPVRKHLPRSRPSQTTSFKVGDAKGYMTAGHYDSGDVGEIFLKLGKQGSTLAGLMDAFSIAISIGLQYGVPLETYVEKFTGMTFEPKGMTGDPDIRFAESVFDYVFKRLALDHLDPETRADLNVLSAEERRILTDGYYGEADLEPSEEAPPRISLAMVERGRGRTMNTPLCGKCGTRMVPTGACNACPSCGTTSGCS